MLQTSYPDQSLVQHIMDNMLQIFTSSKYLVLCSSDVFAKSQAFRQRSILKIFKLYLSARNFLSISSVFHHLYNREILRKISACRGHATVITLCTYIYFDSHSLFDF